MSDALFQNLSTVQSNQQPLPRTITSAATIAPDGFLTFISGATQIANITPPVSGAHMLVFICDTGTTFLTSGNVQAAIVNTADVPTVLIYDPISATYYGFAGNLT